jgi:hypothetical protein
MCASCRVHDCDVLGYEGLRPGIPAPAGAGCPPPSRAASLSQCFCTKSNRQLSAPSTLCSAPSPETGTWHTIRHAASSRRERCKDTLVSTTPCTSNGHIPALRARPVGLQKVLCLAVRFARDARASQSSGLALPGRCLPVRRLRLPCREHTVNTALPTAAL